MVGASQLRAESDWSDDSEYSMLLMNEVQAQEVITPCFQVANTCLSMALFVSPKYNMSISIYESPSLWGTCQCVQRWSKSSSQTQHMMSDENMAGNRVKMPLNYFDPQVNRKAEGCTCSDFAWFFAPKQLCDLSADTNNLSVHSCCLMSHMSVEQDIGFVLCCETIKSSFYTEIAQHRCSTYT